MSNLFLHDELFSILSGRQDKLPHALLLAGQKGIGKFDLAQRFAAALLCEHRAAPGAQACGHCQPCHWLAQGNHPDFRLVQPEALMLAPDTEEKKKKPSQQITIDQIRALDEFLGVGSHRGGLSIVLIHPAEAMNRNAANSILKVLEEPPPSTLFLLVSNDTQRLLPTLRSRCQMVAVPLPEKTLAERYLAEAGVSQPATWLAQAGGAPRIALELHAAGQGGWLENLKRQLPQGNQLDPYQLAGEAEKSVKEGKGSIPPGQIVESLQKWFVDLALLKNGLPPRYFLPETKRLEDLADKLAAEDIVGFYRNLAKRRREAEQPVNTRLFFETLFLDYRALFSS